VHGVEGFGLFAGHANALLRNDAKSGLLDQRIDRAGQIALGCVGFDDRKGALNRHDFVLEQRWWDCGAYIGATGRRQAIRQSDGSSRGLAIRQRRTAQNYSDFTEMNRF
jgi:hypothetical protein